MTAPLQPPSARALVAETARSGAAFALIGGLGALAFIALCNIVLRLPTGIPDWIASALCHAVLIVPVYCAHRRFTFRSDMAHRVALPRYAATQVMTMGLSLLFAIPLYRWLHVDPLPGSIAITGLTSLSSFAIMKLWAFRA